MPKNLSFLACAILVLGLSVGCGADDQQAAEQAAPAQQAAQQDSAEVAMHDCAGPCGMKDVAEDQLTQVDGKWYCAGCVEQARHDHEHAGHDHK